MKVDEGSSINDTLEALSDILTSISAKPSHFPVHYQHIALGLANEEALPGETEAARDMFVACVAATDGQ
jgi:hypothetical protein